MFAKCDRDESCTGKLAPFFFKRSEVCGVNRFFVYIDEEFAINGIQPKFLILSLTGKFRRGATERVRLKRIFTSGEYIVIRRLCIA